MRRGENRKWRCSRARLFLFTAFLGTVALLAFPAFPQAPQKHRKKLSRPVLLDQGVAYQRDPATGEIQIHAAGIPGALAESGIAAASHPIQVVAQFVPVTCRVFAADGAPLHGLARGDFRVYDDGSAQPVTYFDESTEPASVALVIDASPSVLPDAPKMRDAAGALIEGLAPADEVAVVDFSAHTYLQIGFSGVRELLRRAMARVDVRQLLGDTGGSNIYEAVYLTVEKLFRGRAGRKAIVLLTDGQDTGLGLTRDPRSAAPRDPGDNRLTFDDVAGTLAAQDIQVFAVSTENRPRIMTPEWIAAHRSDAFLAQASHEPSIPAYTVYLAELVRRSGGELFFLNEANTLEGVFQQIAMRIGGEYTLGIAPAHAPDAAPNPGWHNLRVEVAGHGSVSVVHRSAYYLPPAP